MRGRESGVTGSRGGGPRGTSVETGLFVLLVLDGRSFLRLNVDANHEGVRGGVGVVGVKRDVKGAGLSTFEDAGKRPSGDPAEGRPAEDRVSRDGCAIEVGGERSYEGRSGRGRGLQGVGRRRCNPRRGGRLE